MSPLPVRVDVNASILPSGEYIGRASVAGSATSSRASPPAAGTVQMSPPETNATSRPSGEIPGSVSAGVCAEATAAKRRSAIDGHRIAGDYLRSGGVRSLVVGFFFQL